MAPPYRGRGGSGGWFRGGRGGDRGTPFKARGDGRGHGGRRGGGSGGMQGGTNVIVEPHHIHEGFFIAKGKKDALLTKNLVPGEAVHGEKRLTVQNEDGTNTEYRILNPFHSKLAALVLLGVDNIWIKPGAKVLYLGPASGTNVSDVSDIVGPTGVVYVVGISHRRGRGRERDLFNMAGWDFFNIAKKRANVVPLIADARHPAKYRMSVGMVDVIFSDIARHDQKRILALNAWHYLKIGGHFVISIKANDVNPLVPAEAVFYAEEVKFHAYQLKPEELMSLDQYVGDHACFVGSFRMPKKDDE